MVDGTYWSVDGCGKAPDACPLVRWNIIKADVAAKVERKVEGDPETDNLRSLLHDSKFVRRAAGNHYTTVHCVG